MAHHPLPPTAAGPDGHEPHPAPGGVRSTARRLRIALGITLATLAADVVGGGVSGSPALPADAAHTGTGATALALAPFAAWLAKRPATPGRSCGFRRAEIPAALVNAAALVAVSVFIFGEAFEQLNAPPEIDTGPMLPVATVGLANALSAWVLSRGGAGENLNGRGAPLHVAGDLLGSVGALAALLMLATGWYLAGPLLSAGIGPLVLWSSRQPLREAVDVVLEATARGIDVAAARPAMAAMGVAGVYDLRAWAVTPGVVALGGHAEAGGDAPWEETRDPLSATLRDRFGIAHVTLRPEPARAEAAGETGRSHEPPEGRAACRSAAPAPIRPPTGHAHCHP